MYISKRRKRWGKPNFGTLKSVCAYPTTAGVDIHMVDKEGDVVGICLRGDEIAEVVETWQRGRRAKRLLIRRNGSDFRID